MLFTNYLKDNFFSDVNEIKVFKSSFLILRRILSSKLQRIKQNRSRSFVFIHYTAHLDYKKVCCQ